jgi:hypothetical protein
MARTWATLKRAASYLKGHPQVKYECYESDKQDVQIVPAYSDSDWANSEKNMRKISRGLASPRRKAGVLRTDPGRDCFCPRLYGPSSSKLCGVCGFRHFRFLPSGSLRGLPLAPGIVRPTTLVFRYCVGVRPAFAPCVVLSLPAPFVGAFFVVLWTLLGCLLSLMVPERQKMSFGSRCSDYRDRLKPCDHIEGPETATARKPVGQCYVPCTT